MLLQKDFLLFMAKIFILFIPLYTFYSIAYIHIKFSLSVHPLTDTEVVYTSWLLWIMLQWTCGCRYFFKTLFLFPSDIYPEVGLLDHMVVVFSLFCVTPLQFSVVAASIYIPPNCAQGFSFFHILFFFFCAISWAAPAAYGGSQARGWIGTIAASLYTTAHGNARSWTHWGRPRIEPTSSWTLCWVLNPLSHVGSSGEAF